MNRKYFILNFLILILFLLISACNNNKKVKPSITKTYNFPEAIDKHNANPLDQITNPNCDNNTCYVPAPK